MQVNYQTWLEEQTIWLNKLEMEFRKKRNRLSLLVIIGSVVALSALGLVVGGFIIAVQNGFFGLIFGLMIVILTTLGTKSPRKYYLKSLKKEMAREFPEDYNQERFAKEMLEAEISNTAKKFVWERSGGRDGKVEISKEYAIIFWENSVTIVTLGKVERMELTDESLTIFTRNEYATVRRQQENYPIKFFYRNTQSASPKKRTFSDKRFNLPTKELRNQIAGAIEDMQHACS